MKPKKKSKVKTEVKTGVKTAVKTKGKRRPRKPSMVPAVEPTVLMTASSVPIIVVWPNRRHCRPRIFIPRNPNETLRELRKYGDAISGDERRIEISEAFVLERRPASHLGKPPIRPNVASDGFFG